MERKASKPCPRPPLMARTIEMEYRVSKYRPRPRPRVPVSWGRNEPTFTNSLDLFDLRNCTVPSGGGDGATGSGRVWLLINNLAVPAFPSPLERRNSFEEAIPSHSTATANQRNEHGSSQRRPFHKAPLRHASARRKLVSVLPAMEGNRAFGTPWPSLHSLAARPLGAGDADRASAPPDGGAAQPGTGHQSATANPSFRS